MKFTLAGKTYSYPHKLSDITLERYVKYLELDKKSPKSIKENLPIDGLSAEELIARADWVCQVVSFWTGAPVDILKKTESADVYALLNTILSVFNQEIPKIDRFEIKGAEYIFPDELLFGTTMGEFADAAAMEAESKELEAGHYSAVAKIMAIYCRKKGEPYVGTLIKEREKLFLTLSIDKVFAFTAFFLKQKTILSQRSIISSLESQLEKNNLLTISKN